MSNIKTFDQLSDSLTNELKWRRLEIQAIKTGIQRSKGLVQDAYIRSAVPIVYAHWEGFVKNAAALYLEFVSGQKLQLGQLNSNIAAITIEYNASKDEKKHIAKVSVIECARDKTEEVLKVPYKNVIDTKSNLNFEVFSVICWQLGLDHSPYKTRKKFIDEEVLKRRNAIAHGEFLGIDGDSIFTIITSILTMLEQFKTDLENAAINKGYKRAV